ncbi:alpha/beta-hydrolase [Microthyrium microscopicum]|uniref:Alpha/beta-hydrolase n=1 Tax=Microthyrium microscopicum TaxID=703497 RepID=A0A6A6U1J5_9PEZI|nr:alpha/beta-hydrolase [Microthyrium microscopicum]
MAAPVVARILRWNSYNVPGRIRITEYYFEVPRDYSNPNSSQTITLFARAGHRIHKPADPTTVAPHQPWMLFLQGGPGFGCSSPQNNAWTQSVLDRGYQVLLLDQRGTGMSTPLSAASLGLRGDEKVQAQYLKSFRADSIVRDCEAVRLALTSGLPPEKQKWSVMGQSYGGFCILSYLSFAPQGLREAFLFGGLQPLVDDPDRVYRATFKKLIERNEAYYNKFPEDIQRVQRITTFLQRFGNTTVKDTSDSGFMTARRFMQLGMAFGFHSGLDSIHDIVIRADNDLTCFGTLTRPTISRIEGYLPFNDAIIYAILHESIYCQGKSSKWSAYRIQKEHEKLFQIPKENPTNPIYFTGEMIFPWMFEDYGELTRIKDQADFVAEFSDWPALFDRAQLKRNEVPVYAASYTDDMFVDFELSMETARAIKGCKTYVTNQMYHDALRSRMDEVFKALWALRDDSID